MRKILPHTKCHIITYTQFRHLSRFYVFCGFLQHYIIIIDTKEWTYRYNDSTVEFCKPPIRHATLSTLALMHWSFTAENQPTNANIRMELDTWLKWVMRSRHTKSKEPEVHSTFLRSEFNTRNDFTNNLNHIKKTPKINMQNYYWNDDAPPNKSITERFFPRFFFLVHSVLFFHLPVTRPDTAFTSN